MKKKPKEMTVADIEAAIKGIRQMRKTIAKMTSEQKKELQRQLNKDKVL